jgi:hypothetical protein
VERTRFTPAVNGRILSLLKIAKHKISKSREGIAVLTV